jgi:plasmid stability protein
VALEAPMAQFVVRQLEDDVVEKLKQRARKNARSMEAEARHILRAAVQQPAAGDRMLGSRIARRFKSMGVTRDLPEFRGVTARAADLDS